MKIQVIIIIVIIVVAALIYKYGSSAPSTSTCPVCSVPPGDIWTGNYTASMGAPTDLISVSSSGNTVSLNFNGTVTTSPIAADGSVQAYGTTGTSNGKQIIWQNGNIWTKISYNASF